MWTPDALRSEARPFEKHIWRVVELQSRAVTMALTDTLEDQALLEDILEETKPLFPPEAEGLHYLLKTPFRYEPYPHGSRFRRAAQRTGVFYGSLFEDTAIAESAFYALLFFAESPDAALPQNGVERTAFQVACATNAAIDLTSQPLVEDAVHWTHPTAYAPCQSLADSARDAKVEAIIYSSVRDPGRRLNVALLTPKAFRRKTPVVNSDRTWRLHITRHGARAMREFPMGRLSFDRAHWAGDPRLG